MEIPEGAPKSVVEMTFFNVNGVDTEFSADDLMNLPEGATFVDRRQSNNRRPLFPIPSR
jgi:hypothetical protein